MSLCRNMVNDFMFNWGSVEPETGEPLYQESDLLFGFDYATGYLAEGYVTDTISGFNLMEFANWCLQKLCELKS